MNASPLSLDQKRVISQLAASAYKAWPEREAYELINSDMAKSKCLEAWRHVEQGKAVGIQSLRECTQAHYLRLKAHFEALGGRLDKAQRTIRREASNGARIALFKLTGALREAGLDEAYAAQICRQMYRVELGHASEKQLWNLFYTIRNRAKAKMEDAGCGRQETGAEPAYVPPEDGDPF